MYCKRCGARIPEGNRFCSQCGAPVEQRATGEKDAAPKPAVALEPEPAPTPTDGTASVPATDAYAAAPDEPTGTGRAKRKAPVVAGTVAAVLLACAGVAFGLHYSGALGANDPLAFLGGAPGQSADAAGAKEPDGRSSATATSAKGNAGEKDAGDSAEDEKDTGSSAGGTDDSSTSDAAADSTQPAKTKTLIVVRQAMTWGDARDYCESRGGELACVTSEAEWAQAKSLMDQSGCSVFWIGGVRSSSGGFAWLDGSTWDYQQWASGEPNNDGGGEDCVAVLKSHGSYAWYDVPNDVSSYYKPEKMAFIMQTES